MYLITAVLFIAVYTVGYRLLTKAPGSLLDRPMSERQLYHHVHSATRYKQ